MMVIIVTLKIVFVQKTQTESSFFESFTWKQLTNSR